MASTAKENTEQSSAGSQSRPPQAAGPEAAEDAQCPICLGPMRRPAYVTFCMHKFCLSCIQQWARTRDNCPVCQQPMEQLLHSVRGDSDYSECAVGLAGRPHRSGDTERGAQPIMAVMLWAMQAVQEQQQRWAARSRPMDAESAERQEALQGPPMPLPTASHEVIPLRERERLAGPAAAPLEPQNGTE